jgi:hypothetical protein
MDQIARTVTVQLRTDFFAVPEGDTSGEVMDEAGGFRLAGTQSYPRFAARTDYDHRLGPVVGGQVQGRLRAILAPEASDEPPVAALFGPISFGVWKSIEEPFYRAAIESSAVSTVEGPRSLHIAAQQRYWIEKVPFATGSLSSIGLAIGGGYEWQRGRADLRGNVGVRWSSLTLADSAVPAADVSRRELAIEGNFQQEATLDGGFLRFGGWADHGFGGDDAYSRGGLFTRIYRDYALGARSSWVLDLLAMAGVSGETPSYRAFTGGNRLDPFLADRVHPASEFVWAGPVLRGYGISNFGLPLTAATVGASDYQGASLTVGLPGFTEPLMARVDASLRPRIDGLIEEAFQESVADMMEQRLRHGVSARKAERSSRREALQLKKVVQNVMEHGHLFTARPLFVVDVAQLRRGTSVRAMSIGGGVRITGLGAGGELLLLKNTSSEADGPPRGYRVVFRGYVRPGRHR